MENVFTYGSLMFDPVWLHVVGARYPSAEATVLGVRRFAVIDEPYPGCVLAPNEATRGRLYFGVAPNHCALLDAFEGEHYARAKCLAILENGQSLPVWIYLYQLPQKLAGRAWDPTRFEENEMAQFLAEYSPTRLGTA